MRKHGIRAAFVAGLALLGCQSFTAHEPVSEPDPAKLHASNNMPNDAVHAKAMQEAQKGKAAAQPGAAVETATASHILIRYVGSLRAGPDVTRSKEDARKLAQQILQRIQGGADFATVANETTEDPSGKGSGGKLGTFPKGRMVPEFDQQVFALPAGGVSGLVETGFGFHIIKREN